MIGLLANMPQEYLGLLAFGTVWFWLLILFEFFLLLAFVENEKYLAAPVSLFIFICAMMTMGSGIDVLHWINNNRILTVCYTVLYFVIGAAYVFPPYIGKWWLFVRDIRSKNRDIKLAWLESWKENRDRTQQTIKSISSSIADLEGKPGSPWELERLEEYKNQLQHAQAQYNALAACNGKMTPELLPFWSEYESVQTCRDWFGRNIPIAKPQPAKFRSRIIAWTVYWPPCLFWTLLNDPLRAIGRRIYEVGAKLLQHISDSAWKDEDKIGTE